MRTLAGDPYMHDPELLRRLGRVRTPALLSWGGSDRIVTPAYGAAYARTFAVLDAHLSRPARAPRPGAAGGGEFGARRRITAGSGEGGGPQAWALPTAVRLPLGRRET
ncbi:hypothetical protein [Kitasatospora sp. NPDC051914]|uniref:hypothetical protein n=1 Tax=Kitasatospora sp. NPDC051914 TaxID=3154945 RepID=UPI00342083C1